MSSGPKSVIIIGAGIGGLATAGLLAKAGFKVTIYEKHTMAGGRAGSLRAEGFTFDTGPSWFLMPEVFERFYRLLGQDMHQLLDLKRLDPAYKVLFEDSTPPVIIHGDEKRDKATFEAIEPGAGEQLTKYLDRAEKTYRTATGSFLYTNFDSYKTFLNPTALKNGPQMLRFAMTSISKYISGFVRHPGLQQILAYPMVFLGTSPFDAPALYHLMSYMDFRQGVFYPMGGMYKIIESLVVLNESLGVKMHLGADVSSIRTASGRATGITLADGQEISADFIISNADLHFTETALLPAEAQAYPESYWQKKTASPGAILMYLGVKGELPELEHHTLVFTKDWHQNFGDIFDRKIWPHPGSMYICRSSATDPGVAPKGHENVFVLVPVMARADVTQAETEAQAELYLDELITQTGISDLRERIVYKKIVGPGDFAADLNAWNGTALGLAHTLKQSALWRPRNKSKKLSNLYYVGGNTIPGVGLPMCLISAELIYKYLQADAPNPLDVKPLKGRVS